MDIGALGAIGDFVGGVAVVVTLGYLAIQIKQSRQELRLNSGMDLSGRAANLTLSYANEPQLVAALETAMRDPAGMDEMDVRRATWIIASYFHMVEALYLRKLVGAISSEAWEAHERIAYGIIRGPFFRAMLKSRQRFAYTDTFREYLDTLISRPVPDDYWEAVTPREMIALIEAELTNGT